MGESTSLLEIKCTANNDVRLGGEEEDPAHLPPPPPPTTPAHAARVRHVSVGNEAGPMAPRTRFFPPDGGLALYPPAARVTNHHSTIPHRCRDGRILHVPTHPSWRIGGTYLSQGYDLRSPGASGLVRRIAQFSRVQGSGKRQWACGWPHLRRLHPHGCSP